MESEKLPSLETIKRLPPREAIPLLDEMIQRNSSDDEIYVVRGMKYWSLNAHKQAMEDYLSALCINPSSRAKTLLEFANSVLGYYNKDLLNP